VQDEIDRRLSLMRKLGRIALPLALVLMLSQSSTEAKATRSEPHRTLLYAYDQTGWILSVILSETESGGRIEVAAIRMSTAGPAGQRSFNISRAEFEKIWAAFNAPGVEKRVVSKAFPVSGSRYDLSNEYVLHDGKQTYAVKKVSSSPAISSAASQLRNYADRAMKTGAMTAVPVNKQTK